LFDAFAGVHFDVSVVAQFVDNLLKRNF